MDIYVTKQFIIFCYELYKNTHSPFEKKTYSEKKLIPKKNIKKPASVVNMYVNKWFVIY